MKKIEIFDPAMCCSTGVCGQSVDPELMRMATVINSLKEKGIIIKRHGLASEPQDFISNKVISDNIQKYGADVLPVTLVDGEVIKTKIYPTNEELSEWLNVEIKAQQSRSRRNRRRRSGGGGCGCGSKGCC